jgi:hypothetical protein
LRQPHLLGSGVSVTHASSARIFSIEEFARGIRISPCFELLPLFAFAPLVVGYNFACSL